MSRWTIEVIHRGGTTISRNRSRGSSTQKYRLEKTQGYSSTTSLQFLARDLEVCTCPFRKLRCCGARNVRVTRNVDDKQVANNLLIFSLLLVKIESIKSYLPCDGCLAVAVQRRQERPLAVHSRLARYGGRKSAYSL